MSTGQAQRLSGFLLLVRGAGSRMRPVQTVWLTLRRAWRPLRQWGWQPWLALTVAYVSVYAVWLALWPPSPRAQTILSHLTALGPSLWAGWAAWRRAPQGGSPRLQIAWRFIGLSALAWALGHALALLLLWLAAPVINGPSLADVAMLGGYVLMAVGLWQYPLAARSSFGRARLLFDMALTSGALLALSWLVLLRPMAHFLGSASLAQIAWAALYPLGDLTLLLIWLNVWLIAGEGRLRSALSFMALAFTARLIAHVALVYGALRGGLSQPLEASAVAGLWLVGLGALYQSRHLPSAEPPTASRRRYWWGRVQALLPLAVIFSLGWYTLMDWQFTHQPDAIGLWATLVLGVAAVARQGVVAGEVELWRYAQLVQSAADPAFICDADGRLQLINPATLTATGYQHEAELLGQPFTKLVSWEPWDAALQREHLFTEGWSGEARLRRRTGEAVTVSLSLRPVRHALTARPALAGLAHDLTQVKQQEATLRAAYYEVTAARRALEALNAHLEQRVDEETRNLSAANAQLAEQNAALQTLDQLKSDFVSLVSHELRAPLTTVSGGIELLLSEPDELSPRARESLTLVQIHLRRLAQFVSTILDLSALEAGRWPLALEPIDLAAVLNTVQQPLALNADGPAIRVRLPAGLPRLLADRQALTSVIFHLVDNALKYAPHSAVELEAQAEAGRVRVQVSDDGPGIPPEWREKIFEKFERVDQADARAVYGHGLGLYMCRKLLQMMDGDIVAGEAPHGGAQFTFWLPTAENDHGA